LEKNRKVFEKVLGFFTFQVLFFLGVKKNVSRNMAEKVYKKYFGENYNFTFDEKYSLIISNHTSWVVKK
jgi:hypothetical protein